MYISNKYINNKTDIKDWLVRTICSDNAVFLSLKFNTYIPRDKNKLIKEIRNILSHLFRILLGRHWLKTYNKMFRIFTIQEFGKNGSNRHCHIIIDCANIKFNPRTIINSLDTIKNKCRFDLYEKTQATDNVNITHNYNKSIVASTIYSNDVFDYIIKEIKFSNNFDNLILDTEIFI